MAELTPRRVVTGITRMIAACALESESPISVQAEGEHYREILEAALMAYKSEYQRQWLEANYINISRGVYNGEWRWFANWLGFSPALTLLAEANPDGWRTRAETENAAAAAVGYPGLKDAP